MKAPKPLVLLWAMLLISVPGIPSIWTNGWEKVSASSTERTIFFDDFNSGNYSNNWITGPYSWYGYTNEWLSANGHWLEKNGYLYGRGDGDWNYIYTKSKVPSRGITIEARVKLEDDSNAVIALIPDDPKNPSHIIAGADIIAYPSDSGWKAISGNGTKKHETYTRDNSIVNGRWYTIRIVIPEDGSEVIVYDGETGKIKAVDTHYTVPKGYAYLVLDARGSWGSGANVLFDYVAVYNKAAPYLSPETLSRGLVAYYSFDHCDARDDSGNGHDGTIYGNPKCVDGVKGYALWFNGEDSYVEVPRVTKYSFTVSLWLKTTQVGMEVEDWHFYGATGIVENENVGGTGDWGLGLVDNYAIFGINNEPNVISKTKVNTGDWVFITAVRDAAAGKIEIYINGILEDSKNASKGPLTSVDTIWIGRLQADPGDYQPFFNGAIDEVRIYNRALSPEEIQALYQQGLSGSQQPHVSMKIDSSAFPSKVSIALSLSMPHPTLSASSIEVYENGEKQDIHVDEHNVDSGGQHFLLHYTPTNQSMDGGKRQVRIVIHIPDGSTLEVTGSYVALVAKKERYELTPTDKEALMLLNKIDGWFKDAENNFKGAGIDLSCVNLAEEAGFGGGGAGARRDNFIPPTPTEMGCLYDQFLTANKILPKLSLTKGDVVKLEEYLTNRKTSDFTLGRFSIHVTSLGTNTTYTITSGDATFYITTTHIMRQKEVQVVPKDLHTMIPYDGKVKLEMEHSSIEIWKSIPNGEGYLIPKIVFTRDTITRLDTWPPQVIIPKEELNKRTDMILSQRFGKKTFKLEPVSLGDSSIYLSLTGSGSIKVKVLGTGAEMSCEIGQGIHINIPTGEIKNTLESSVNIELSAGTPITGSIAVEAKNMWV